MEASTVRQPRRQILPRGRAGHRPGDQRQSQNPQQRPPETHLDDDLTPLRPAFRGRPKVSRIAAALNGQVWPAQDANDRLPVVGQLLGLTTVAEQRVGRSLETEP